jgi:spore coat polysaccharide biosynthesis protein SpsF
MSRLLPSAIFLSVRNKATRLPGKVLLDLEGATVTERLIERLKGAREADGIVVTTSIHPDDASLLEVARRCGVGAFRGSEDDKLDRYLQAAREFGVELVAVVDGDDPFSDPGYIDRLLVELRESNVDFATVADLPVGVAANAIRVSALEKVCAIKTEADTEVWAGYFTQTGLFKTRILKADPPHRAPHLRMTLDYPEDYDFFRAVYRELHRPGRVFSLDEILELLRRRPEIGEINRGATARYEANLGRITKIGIRAGAAS